MKDKTLVNRCLILALCIMAAVLVKMLLRNSRLEKKVKWLSQRIALANEKTH